ncbi:alkyl hydroperoxide reductase subunit F, partial [Klebsiella pneumoniae]|nr:alkyl hydroperoxide reductase subunit F [Klebsiella pneumoniae]
MVLEANIKAQLNQYMQLMENDIVLKVSVGEDDTSKDMLALVEELASMSSKITIEKAQLNRTPSFSV